VKTELTLPSPAINPDRNLVSKTTSQSRLRNRLYSFLTVLVSLLLALTVAELALRLWGWPAPGFYVNGSGPVALRTPGPNGGAYPPNTKGTLKHYDYDVNWSVNGDGFREREPGPKTKNEWRVGFVGDSFTAGVGIEESQRFQDVWLAKMRDKFPNLTAWNIASPVCGTLCEAQMLSGAGKKYDLDEILLVFYGGNDVEDNAEEYSDLNSGRPKVVAGSSQVFKDWLREHSRLATFAWVSAIRAFATIKPPGIYSAGKLAPFWPATERALAEFKQSAEPRPLTVMYIPTVPEWDQKTWEEISRKQGLGNDSRFVVKESIARWCQQNEVGFLDSTPWLQRCESTAQCVFPVDGHWNRRAHALVGEQLSVNWKPKFFNAE
jgi:hypothetical protein